MRLRQPVALMVGMVALLAMVSCSAHKPRQVAGGQPLTEPEKEVLHEAEQMLTRSCMKDHGFEMWAVPRQPLPEDHDFPYVIDDVEWASRHGYGSDIDAERSRLRAADPNRRYFENLPPAEQARALEALNGRQSAARLEVRTPDGVTMGRIADGCTSQAQQEIYGDLASWFRVTSVTDSLTALWRADVTADDRFESAVRRWSSCMKARGFDYLTPLKAREAFLRSPQSADRPQEIRTAVAEAECAHSTGMSTDLQRMEEQYRIQRTRQHQTDVDTRARLEHEALPRARAALADIGRSGEG
ncbi:MULTISPECIES: hypothetical protein [unclassified Frankia]|uniref:hypothetical protein n=1 Tax=unclassified Frankia TaxID=2632575 RepID=UPI001EF4612B|nr:MULTISPECIES: hypothetical protein [unclassified Frankia]